MVNNVILKGEFKPFKVSEYVHFEILQFADDTMIIREGSWSNLLSIKGFMRGFNIVYGICVNFHKESCMGLI